MCTHCSFAACWSVFHSVLYVVSSCATRFSSLIFPAYTFLDPFFTPGSFGLFALIYRVAAGLSPATVLAAVSSFFAFRFPPFHSLPSATPVTVRWGLLLGFTLICSITHAFFVGSFAPIGGAFVVLIVCLFNPLRRCSVNVLTYTHLPTPCIPTPSLLASSLSPLAFFREWNHKRFVHPMVPTFIV